MRVNGDAREAQVVSQTRESPRRGEASRFRGLIDRALRRDQDEAAIRPSPEADARFPIPEDEPCCAACASLEGLPELELPEVDDFGFVPIEPAELEAAIEGLMVDGVLEPSRLLDPLPITYAPIETAAALAFYLRDTREHLDRHRRFELQVTHPVHGLLVLTGTLKGDRLQVAYQVDARAHPHLREVRPHLEAALADEGLKLVSFLPETPQGR